VNRLFILLLVLLYTLPARSQSEQQVSLRSRLGKEPRLALVLSGGGARGFAHIGVLQILDSANIPIDLIVGTSMGAIIGGYYAAGYSPNELEKIAKETNWSEIFDLEDDSKRIERSLGRKDESAGLLSMRFNGFFDVVIPQALSSGQRLTMLLNSLTLNSPYGSQDDFLHEFRVPFVALATDIVTGSRKIITSGDLTSAIRASATVPLRFNPVEIDSAIFVDGGLLTNVPVDIALDSAGSKIIIASNTTSDLHPRNDLKTPWDVADQVITLMMQRENQEQMQHADVVITPLLSGVAADDFSKAEEYINAGRIATRKVLSAIKDVLSKTPQLPPDALSDDTLITKVNEIRVHSFGAIPIASPGQLFREHVDLPLTRSQATNEIVRPLIDSLRVRGYSLARVDSAIIYSRIGRLDLYLDEGIIGDIRIKGTQAVNDELVLTEFPLSKGDVFRSEVSERGIRNLTATGYFTFASLEVKHDTARNGLAFIMRGDTVLPAIAPRSPGPYAPELVISVAEKAMNVLRIGALADNEFGAQFSMEYANENVFATGFEFSVKGGLGPRSRYAAATLFSNTFFSPFTTFLLQAYTGYKDITSYVRTINIPEGRIFLSESDLVREARDIGGRIRFGGEVGRVASLMAELRYERQRAYSRQTFVSLDQRRTLSALKAEFVVDSRDDAAFPHAGSYFDGYFEQGVPFFGGQEQYSKLFGYYEQAIPLSRLHTAIGRIGIGVGDKTIPRQELFALGGMENFYGLAAYELRGKQVVSASAAYQVSIPNALFIPIFVTFRYDIGAAWLEPERIKFEALTHGLSAQLGFKTPIGLARFGLGQNFSFAQSEKKPLLLADPKFYFSIGANL
jgi:predicted acylesterase/phospholipase RssA/outer membrane translocation and assembly module TamA